jgi:hypothetical protein
MFMMSSLFCLHQLQGFRCQTLRSKLQLKIKCLSHLAWLLTWCAELASHSPNFKVVGTQLKFICVTILIHSLHISWIGRGNLYLWCFFYIATLCRAHWSCTISTHFLTPLPCIHCCPTHHCIFMEESCFLQCLTYDINDLL